MNWVVAGLIGGFAAYIADWVLWSKVIGAKGMEAFATPPAAGQPVNMGPLMLKSALLAVAYGVVFAFVYRRFLGTLWTAPGVLGAMELATVMWLPLAFASTGCNVWFDRTRRLVNAQMWVWLIRMNAAAIVVGLFVRAI